MIGDRGHDPRKSIQIYPVKGVGGVAGFSLSATFQGSNSLMREILWSAIWVRTYSR